MSDIKWTPIIVVGLIALIIGGFIGSIAFAKEIETTCPELNETCPTTNQTCPECAVCKECKTCEEIEAEAKITGGYLLDGLYLENSEKFPKTLSDRELNLFDGEVDFDGDDYDAEEFLVLNGIELKANGNDFDGIPYLTFEEGSINYKFNFESTLDISKIGEDDETLKFDLLGENVEISKWDGNEIKFTKGKEYTLEEGETITVDDEEVTLLYIIDDKVYVTVGEDSKNIREGDVKSVGNLEIKAREVLDFGSRTDKTNRAVLVIGEEVETTIKDSDEYEEDSIWEWVISENSIGLVLVEKFMELDNDFNALKQEEKICLPNDYVCVRYNGLIGGDEEEYTFELDKKNNLNYVRVNGNFLSGTEDYDRIYINASGIYDRDFEEISNINIELGDTDSILEINATHITINDFWVNLNLNTTNAVDDDVNYLTNYGILIENPEDSIKDQEFTITVPEERLEGVITVKQGGFEVESNCNKDNLNLCLDETTCDNANGYWYDDVCNVKEASSE